MPFDPISYYYSILGMKRPTLAGLIIDTDKDWQGYRIINLGDPVDPNDMVTKYYVDLTMSGINITYYMLNEQDPDVTTYKKTSIIPVDGTEQYIDVSGNSGDSVYVGGWITPADATPSVLPAGIIVMTMKARRVSGNLRIYGYFELYERKSDGSEVLIGTSAESGKIRAVDMYAATLPLFDNYYLESGSRIVIKAYVRFAGSGGTTTVRVFFEGNTASRLTLPTSKEVLDKLYFSPNVVTVTSDYTAKKGDVVLASASGGAITITLPAPQANAIVVVKKVDSSANAVTVDGGGADIDGQPSIQMTTQYESYTFISDGSNWWII